VPIGYLENASLGVKKTAVKYKISRLPSGGLNRTNLPKKASNSNDDCGNDDDEEKMPRMVIKLPYQQKVVVLRFGTQVFKYSLLKKPLHQVPVFNNAMTYWPLQPYITRSYTIQYVCRYVKSLMQRLPYLLKNIV